MHGLCCLPICAALNLEPSNDPRDNAMGLTYANVGLTNSFQQGQSGR